VERKDDERGRERQAAALVAGRIGQHAVCRAEGPGVRVDGGRQLQGGCSREQQAAHQRGAGACHECGESLGSAVHFLGGLGVGRWLRCAQAMAAAAMQVMLYTVLASLAAGAAAIHALQQFSIGRQIASEGRRRR